MKTEDYLQSARDMKFRLDELEKGRNEQQPSDPCDGCRYELNSTNGNPCYSCGKYKLSEQQPTVDTRQMERQLEMEYQHGYDKGWEEGRKAFEQATPLEAQPSDEKNYLKRREKDYVSYNIEWLLKHWERELDILSGGKIKPSDAVSREAVLRIISKAEEADDVNCGYWIPDSDNVRWNIRHLPPVTPQRPKGKWIEVEVHNCYATLKCSICSRVIEPTFTFGEYSYEDIKTFYPYCHCGAEMNGGGEDDR